MSVDFQCILSLCFMSLTVIGYMHRPTSLWILNPSLLLRAQPKYDDLTGSDRDLLGGTRQNSYGAVNTKGRSTCTCACWL